MEEGKTIYPYQNLDLEDLEGEIWKDIAGYEGMYQVSNMGRVKSVERTIIKKNGKICYYETKLLKQIFTRRGYLHVLLYKEGKIKWFYIHRLVAKAFLDDYSEELTVNHKSEFEKQLNTVSNLEMMSLQDNNNYGTHNERCCKALSKQVGQFTLDGTLLAVFPSISECGRQGFDYSAVGKCCRNKYNREGNNIFKNYIWQYI